MIGFRAKVTYGDGPQADEAIVNSNGDNPKITASVLIAFERHWDKSIVTMFGNDMMFEPLLWLGWECLRQSGVTVKPFDAWVKENDPSVELVSPTPLETTEPPD